MLEIVCLSSLVGDFDSNAWHIRKEYDARVISDIEVQIKKWETLDKAIDPGAWQFAKEFVAKSKTTGPNQSKTQGNSTRICSTWNTFRNDGCSWEHSNPGESCVFLHICSKCKKKQGLAMSK